MTKRAALTARVSSPKQAADSKTSIETQIKHMQAFVQQRGWTLRTEHIFVDAESGTVPDREGIEAILRLAERKEIDVVVCFVLDRLGRDVVESLILLRELTRLGVAVYSLDLNRRASHTDLLTIVKAAIAQDELGRIKSRMVNGKIAQLDRGNLRALGSNTVPYGYTKNYTIDEPAANVIRRIFTQFVEYEHSANAVAAYLNREGIPTPTRRNIWLHAVVVQMLRNRAYIGERIVQFREVVDAEDGLEERVHSWTFPIPPIIDRHTFERAQELLRLNKAYALAHHTHKRDYPLSGRIFCAECNQTRRIKTVMNRYKQAYRYYVCPQKRRDNRAVTICNASHIRVEKAEHAAWDALCAFMTHQRIEASIQRQEACRKEPDAANADRLRTIARLRERQARMVRTQMELGEVLDAKVLDDLRADLRTITQDITTLEAQHAETARAQTPTYVNQLQVLLAECDEIRQIMPLMDEHERAMFYRKIGLRVLVSRMGEIADICIAGDVSILCPLD